MSFDDKKNLRKNERITVATDIKENYCRNLHDQKKIIVMKNFLSMFSCMYVNSQWLTTLNRGF